MPDLAPFSIERPYGWAVVTLEVFQEDGQMVCCIHKVRGKIAIRRRWYKIIRGHLRRIERHAKAAGCTEMRVAGRKWHRVLTDYEPLDGLRNGLRKAI